MCSRACFLDFSLEVALMEAFELRRHKSNPGLDAPKSSGEDVHVLLLKIIKTPLCACVLSLFFCLNYKLPVITTSSVGATRRPRAEADRARDSSPLKVLPLVLLLRGHSCLLCMYAVAARWRHFLGKVYLPAPEKRMNFNERIESFVLLLLSGEKLPPAVAQTAADARQRNAEKGTHAHTF